ncbi:hypothetical protein TRFO_05193 [Tritrichomonas foetus]|uniref:Transmembrane protein 231 n=1 Tax=Tritrichomonas foetus TaxID=1144522 RepID=A0A1J4KD28_9EUKA|nr:hypothetical protein TRFO_05193 [Tritrichomonas foetus]|eukprot:OHT07558.1 hypothetical protein TRFO_05193 [Tritrichomonas foetus]
MINVWQDAEVPVEYRAPELHFQNWGKVGFFGNLIQTISPLIQIIITLLFVVMSYYVAPESLLIKENPVVYPPQYFLAVGHIFDSTQPAVVNAKSFLYSNFPQFSENQIRSRTIGGRLSSAVNDAGYLDMQLALPYQRATGERLMQLTLLLPLTINFPKIDHKNVHTMIHYQVRSNNFDTVNTIGRLQLTQRRTIPDDEPFSSSVMKDVLQSKLSVSGSKPFDLDYILEQFENTSFTAKIMKTTETTQNFNNNFINVRIQIRIPEIFAEIKAPFWNMFKVTYVQLFYWFWLVYFVWNLFIKTGFTYGIIPATMRRVLKPSKPKFD